MVIESYGVKKQIISMSDPDISVGTKVNILEVFSFRAFLNIAMIISESEKAKVIRSVIL